MMIAKKRILRMYRESKNLRENFSPNSNWDQSYDQSRSQFLVRFPQTFIDDLMIG